MLSSLTLSSKDEFIEGPLASINTFPDLFFSIVEGLLFKVTFIKDMVLCNSLFRKLLAFLLTRMFYIYQPKVTILFHFLENVDLFIFSINFIISLQKNKFWE